VSTVTLLDVNVLIALVDPLHVHHELCHHWFSTRGSAPWASCAITQNGVLRILGNARYPNSPGSTAVVSRILQALVMHPQHQFWESSPSLLSLAHVEPLALLDPAQITDTYLLALAIHHGGRLATLDGRVSAHPVKGGAEALEVISA
jgi:toxin-antitoxin system PIN domain toxin